MDWQAIALSLRLSVCTTVILIVLGLPLGWWLASTRWRGRFLIEALVALPIVLPPTVLGYYLLMAMSPQSRGGQLYEAIFGSRLPFSFSGLLIASVLYSLPFAVQPFVSAFATLDRRMIEASWCLGVGRAGTFRRVVIPLAWPGILTGMVLSFAHTMGEFGVVLMVGGNLPGVTRTVSISIYDEVQALNYEAAGQTAMAMLLFSFIVLAFTYSFQRRFTSLWTLR